MNKEFLKYLAEVEKFLTSNEIGEKTFGEGGCKITVGRTENGFYTNCIVQNNELQDCKDNFTKYLNDIEDDLFVGICEHIEEHYNGFLHKLDELMHGDDLVTLREGIRNFKLVAQEFVQNKINNLTKCLHKLAR